MKYYKLKKDIPMFKAGDLFYINSDQGCLVQKDTIRLAFHKETLEEYPEILRDWFEEVEEPGYKRWRAEEDDEYYTINRIGCVCRSRDTRQPEDDYRYKTGSYGRTAEELEAKLKYDIARQVLLDDAEGGKFIQGEENWGNFYSTIYDRWGALNDSIIHPGAIYFITREACRKSFEEHREQWEIVRKYEMGEL